MDAPTNGLATIKGGISMLSIDLNADAGESCTHEQWLREQAVIPIVSSVNVACGWHAGSAALMMQTVQCALRHRVAIGAHPGLPDEGGFGRRALAMSASELYTAVLYQVGALQAVVQAAGGTLRHVKPHGALYHMAAEDATIAVAVASAVADVDRNLLLFAPSSSALAVAGHEKRLRVIGEAFADRTYEESGKLTSRNRANAVITSQTEAVRQTLAIVCQQKVQATSGTIMPLSAQTVCVHGDNEHAGNLLRAVRTALEDVGVTIAAP